MRNSVAKKLRKEAAAALVPEQVAKRLTGEKPSSFTSKCRDLKKGHMTTGVTVKRKVSKRQLREVPKRYAAKVFKKLIGEE
jgi:hypothetical protein